MSSKNVIGCPYAKKCGGCQLQNMDYNRQLKFKQAKTVSTLGKFHRVYDIIGMENPYNYRNKVQAAFGLTRSGKIVSGVYQSSSHRIVNTDKCMIEDKIADEIIVFIRSILPEFRILPYNEDSKKGFLRHVLVKRSFSTGQLMVVFVAASPVFPQKNNITKCLLKRFPDITTVVLNINPHKTSMLLSDRQEVLFGKGYIEDELCGLKFRISPKSFYQINPVQTKLLYETALEYAELDKSQTVIDAYCGTGTIGLCAAGYVKEVIGVELNADAVKDAKINAKINGVKNARFFKGDAGEFMVEAAKENINIDTVFMDPPRAGSDKAFLSSIVKLSPERVVYISCNIETQKRDLLFLVKNGYKVRKIQPIDMFPHTSHIECVVLLSRKEKFLKQF